MWGGRWGGGLLHVVEDGELAVDEDVEGADEVVEVFGAAGALETGFWLGRGGCGGGGRGWSRGGGGGDVVVHGLMDSWVGHLGMRCCNAAMQGQRCLRGQSRRCCWLDRVEASTIDRW